MGVLLYEALTGMKPFPAELPTDIIRQILDSEAIPPRRLRPGTPPELDRLLLAMLAKQPVQRPDEQTVIEQLRRIDTRDAGPGDAANRASAATAANARG